MFNQAVSDHRRERKEPICGRATEGPIFSAKGHSDVAGTYAQLTRGSRNHLRAFHGRITGAGASYTPVHLDQAAYDAIVTSAKETGMR